MKGGKNEGRGEQKKKRNKTISCILDFIPKIREKINNKNNFKNAMCLEVKSHASK